MAVVAAVTMAMGVVTLLCAGLCAELIMRARHAAAQSRPYRIARSVNL
jgi:hypothetical protein